MDIKFAGKSIDTSSLPDLDDAHQESVHGSKARKSPLRFTPVPKTTLVFDEYMKKIEASRWEVVSSPKTLLDRLTSFYDEYADRLTHRQRRLYDQWSKICTSSVDSMDKHSGDFSARLDSMLKERDHVNATRQKLARVNRERAKMAEGDQDVRPGLS